VKHPHVLLVTIDALRADRVGRNSLTPRMDRLAGDAVSWSRAYATGVPTFYSFSGIMASRYALRRGVTRMQIEPDDLTLAEHLRSTGYRTAAFVSTNPYVSRVCHYDRGFDHFVDYLKLTGSSANPVPPVPRAGSKLPLWLRNRIRPIRDFADEVDQLYLSGEYRPYVPARRVVDDALGWIASQHSDRPFFVWLHLMDVHAPYYPRSSAAELAQWKLPTRLRQKRLNATWNMNWHAPTTVETAAKSAIRGEVVALYDACVRGVDAEVGRLADSLRGLGIWKNLVWAITSDHGEELLDHGGVFHPPGKSTEELVRVPLIAAGPGVAQRSITSTVSLLGLAPTLSEFAGIAPAANWKGTSIADSERDAEVVIESLEDAGANPLNLQGVGLHRSVAVIGARWKMVWRQSNDEWTLYDLDSDPEESRAIRVNAWPPQAAAMRRLAEAHVADVPLRDRVRERAAVLRQRFASRRH